MGNTVDVRCGFLNAFDRLITAPRPVCDVTKTVLPGVNAEFVADDVRDALGLDLCMLSANGIDDLLCRIVQHRMRQLVRERLDFMSGGKQPRNDDQALIEDAGAVSRAREGRDANGITESLSDRREAVKRLVGIVTGEALGDCGQRLALGLRDVEDVRDAEVSNNAFDGLITISLRGANGGNNRCKDRDATLAATNVPAELLPFAKAGDPRCVRTLLSNQNAIAPGVCVEPSLYVERRGYIMESHAE